MSLRIGSMMIRANRDDDDDDDDDDSTWWIKLLAVLFCVTMAALAAGLTLGLLGLDPLVLLVKQRAGESQAEREIARVLLPVVKQHHRLLVTLLLMNSIANEALPIFLEDLVPPSVAILLSVTLVLFFGEIIPSAIFTGPNKLTLAHRLLPLVKAIMCLFYPVAAPIAALLDMLLHDEDDATAYNRGELAALVRIHYEARLTSKRSKRHQMERSLVNGDHLGALDFTSNIRKKDQRLEVRAVKSQLEHENKCPWLVKHDELSHSIHQDEVLMVEGALQMKTKVVLDVFTPMSKTFTIPDDMELTGSNLVQIYASCFTRVPVYRSGNKLGVVGVLLTRHLIVVEPNDRRLVRTLPLRTPYCVSPAMPLVNILNYFQTGGSKGGHLALVCAVPQLGNTALRHGQEIPEAAGLMGIVTLEDVMEMLLQEEIYDEMDREKQSADLLANKIVVQRRKYVERKKAHALSIMLDSTTEDSIPNNVTETTSLLQK